MNLPLMLDYTEQELSNQIKVVHRIKWTSVLHFQQHPCILLLLPTIHFQLNQWPPTIPMIQ